MMADNTYLIPTMPKPTDIMIAWMKEYMLRITGEDWDISLQTEMWDMQFIFRRGDFARKSGNFSFLDHMWMGDEIESFMGRNCDMIADIYKRELE